MRANFFSHIYDGQKNDGNNLVEFTRKSWKFLDSIEPGTLRVALEASIQPLQPGKNKQPFKTRKPVMMSNLLQHSKMT